MSASNAQPFPLLTLDRYENATYSGFKAMYQLKYMVEFCEFGVSPVQSRFKTPRFSLFSIVVYLHLTPETNVLLSFSL